MKFFALLLLTGALVSGLRARAQEALPESTSSTAPAVLQAPEEQLTSVAEPEAENPKLKPGHPLDPADVAILTGRSSQGSGSEGGYGRRSDIVVDLSAGPVYRRRGSLLNPFAPGVRSPFWLVKGPPLFFLRGRHPRPVIKPVIFD